MSKEGKSDYNDSHDDGITMVDVLQEEESLEDDAEAVLGAGDDSVCTYDQGYLKRQPLYACQTCIPEESGGIGGICLGCSYHCHEGHDLVELYTKRNFKCDCGNAKYPDSNPCKLTKDKMPENVDNFYNHNFKGKYCICNRPYPDPEDHIEDQMIQCVICEDWYHGRHLNVEMLPSEDDFSEMICQLCIPKLPFLNYYLGISVTVVKKEDSNCDVSVTEKATTMDSTQTSSGTKELIVEDAKDMKESISVANFCKFLKMKEVKHVKGAVFFTENWRKELCNCISCKERYVQLTVSFLTDPEDTVSHYESEGRAKRVTQRGIEREIDALSSLDRITRTEVVYEYNNLSVSLREYLKKFADNGKVVRDEDIREFFSNLTANKKQKKESKMQYFCK